MKVYKFGGASLKDAAHIQNLAEILKKESAERLILVVSAMGKTTNKLEEILESFRKQNGDYKQQLLSLKEDFETVATGLFKRESSIFDTINYLFQKLDATLMENAKKSYNFLYDQVVSFGELMTSELVSAYLNNEGWANELLDARNYIQTDTTYRDATVDWAVTCQNIEKLSGEEKCFITQGFIARDKQGNTTTLGREGSDYSAAIFAYCLDAKDLTIWKDVEGVLNADPRHFSDTVLLNQISFTEAIELAYYGASVIHPKTIQPLHIKGIPLRVRSFLAPSGEGSKISHGQALVPNVPCYILKKKQQLLQVASKDFSFIVENDISDIFKTLHTTQMKVNLLHNSAISLALCIDDRLGDIKECRSILEKKYNITYKEGVTLYTVRNFCEKDFEKRFGAIEPLLRQSKDDVVHVIVEANDEN